MQSFCLNKKSQIKTKFAQSCIIEKIIMRRKTTEEYRKVLSFDRSISSRKIADQMEMHYSTVLYIRKKYSSLAEYDLVTQQVKRNYGEARLPEDYKDYAYILGMYLGDGHIVKMGRTYRICIALDNKYPKLIEECEKRAKYLYQHNSVNRGAQTGCSWVYWYSNNLPTDFPQHGPGTKHTRKIELADWQENIVEKYPKDFIRGLLHSDGSRFKRTVHGKEYWAYNFVNESRDISAMLHKSLEQLGIKYRVNQNGRTTNIATKPAIAFLDTFVGPKA